MHLALLHLGFESTHFPKALWHDLHHPITGQYDAFSDTPVSLLYPKLDKAFPGSRFILTTRAIDTWLRSCSWMFEKKYNTWRFGEEPTRSFHQELFGTHRFDVEKFTAAHHQFHEEVARYFTNRKDLLVLDLENEPAPWEKLCAFLQMAVPSVAFPHHRDHGIELVNRAMSWLEERKYKKARA